MARKLWAVYVSDRREGTDRRVSPPLGTVEEARSLARALNSVPAHRHSLYYAGHVSGDGPTPAGRTDYPEDGGSSPVPWGWREERPQEQSE